MDCVKIAQPIPNPKQETPVYNPAVTNASSDHEKLPRMINDPVIDQHFKINNARLFQDIMTQEAESVLANKGYNPMNVFESDFSKSHKLAEFDEFLANRRTNTSSPTSKKDDMMNFRSYGGNYSNGLGQDIGMMNSH